MYANIYLSLYTLFTKNVFFYLGKKKRLMLSLLQLFKILLSFLSELILITCVFSG